MDVETLLNEAIEMHPKSSDNIKSALRDLGLKVHLKEEWTGGNTEKVVIDNWKFLYIIHSQYHFAHSKSTWTSIWEILFWNELRKDRLPSQYSLLKEWVLNYTYTKVESSLLQIDPAHRWKFFQTFFETNQNKKSKFHSHWRSPLDNLMN